MKLFGCFILQIFIRSKKRSLHTKCWILPIIFLGVELDCAHFGPYHTIIEHERAL